MHCSSFLAVAGGFPRLQQGTAGRPRSSAKHLRTKEQSVKPRRMLRRLQINKALPAPPASASFARRAAAFGKNLLAVRFLDC